MLILGLTGGIATGKSTVSRTLAEKYNIPIIDADLIAREIVEPHTPSYDAIVKHFSQSIPDLTNGENGPLNRVALGTYVFKNKSELAILNSITHPAVRKRILALILQNYIQRQPVVVLDVPLLFESGMDWLCSRILTISCEPNVQLERLSQRNPELTEDEARNRIKSQMSITDKAKLSDFVIANDGSLSDLESAINEFVQLRLPAISTNKEIRPVAFLIHRLWNYVQLFFPPLAFMGGILALLRKSSNKVVGYFIQ